MTQAKAAPVYSVRRTRWGSIAFFLVLTSVTLIGVPLYFVLLGFSWKPIILLVTYSFVTILAITSGYHRFFAHAAFKAHPIVRFFVLFFGAATFQQSALKWASQHRAHHKYVDTERDPYNIKRGFFYAHMGWILFWKQSTDYSNVTDLKKSRLTMHQHNHYQAWAITAGVVVPMLIGVLMHDMAGALIFGIAARLTWVHHSTFFINSVAHTLGTADYDPDSSARDHWFCALLTNGEGYHNFHHRFPSDYRNGVRWYHWDPTKWAIWMLSKVRLTWELKTTPYSRILEVRNQVRR